MTGESAKGLREAMLYESADSVVNCRLCNHHCIIKDGARGICGVRVNRGGTLYTLAYGRLIARHVDPIEKKPLFHFQPGTMSYSIATVGCNFRCGFCQNWQISQAERGGAMLPGEKESPEEIVRNAVRNRCASIAYTYTEPTIFFEYAYDTAVLAKEEGLTNVFVTNGYQTPETVEKMRGVIDAANVDLKSFSEEFYVKLCKARLKPVLETIRNMYEGGIFIEVTTLVIPGKNDSDAELRQIAEFLVGVSPDIPWHVSAFHPDYEMLDGHMTPVERLLRAMEIGKEAGVKYVYAGNVAGAGLEDTHCPACGKTVIGRRGFFVGERHLDGKRCGYCGEELNLVV